MHTSTIRCQSHLKLSEPKEHIFDGLIEEFVQLINLHFCLPLQFRRVLQPERPKTFTRNQLLDTGAKEVLELLRLQVSVDGLESATDSIMLIIALAEGGGDHLLPRWRHSIIFLIC